MASITVTEAKDTPEPGSSGLRTIRKVLPYLWPQDQPWVKRRVVLSLSILFVAKLVSVGTPFFYKAAVDALSGEAISGAAMLA